MTQQEFDYTLNLLVEKCHLEDAESPFASSEYEAADIFIDPETGIFYLSDKRGNWLKSPYALNDIENMRYKNYYDLMSFKHDEDDKLVMSSIYINFKTGDSLELIYDHNLTYEWEIRKYFDKATTAAGATVQETTDGIE